MFIVWGKKLVHRKQGYVADFCPFCREFRAFELKRLGSASHVYYLTLGEGDLLGFECTCQECGTVLKTDPGRYATVAKRALPIDELLTQTFPNGEDLLRERMDLERRARQDPRSVSPEDRRALIRSPFILLSPKVERRFASAKLDMGIGLALIGAIALLVSGPSIAQVVAPGADVGNVVLLSTVTGIALIAWQGVESSKRFMRREILPLLASNLKPLRPTESELSSVIAEMKQLGHKIGKKIKQADLEALLCTASRVRQ